MINLHDFYNVMVAMVPLYVAMGLAYASVRWWKLFTAEQCSGIDGFVATFAVPFLSFHFVYTNNPYKMNFIFLAADTLQKVFLLLLFASVAFFLRHRTIAGSTPFEWLITLFSLATLPNTLVMGIPLLEAMYGQASGAGSLMVQVVVLQLIVWSTLVLVLFECRGAWTLITERFPESAASIASFTVESDVVSLDGREPLDTDAQVLADGRLHVNVRRSTSSGIGAFPRFPSIARPDIFSVEGPNINNAEMYRKSGYGSGATGFCSDHLTVRPTNTHLLEASVGGSLRSSTVNDPYPIPNPKIVGGRSKSTSGYNRQLQRKGSYGVKAVHMFRRSMSESPAVGVFGGGRRAALAGERWRHSTESAKDIRINSSDRTHTRNIALLEEGNQETEFPAEAEGSIDEGGGGVETTTGNQMPPASVMTKLILIMVWRKQIRNPNTYSSIIGLVWSLVAYRCNVELPKIIANSISILSNTGLGLIMFSLGLFMARQPKLIPCGKSLALLSMGVRFIVGPAVATAAAVVIGIRGDLLRITFVQAALPQAILPFVFARVYDNHPTLLSTAVIFGMLVALPIDLMYYIVLGLT